MGMGGKLGGERPGLWPSRPSVPELTVRLRFSPSLWDLGRGPAGSEGVSSGKREPEEKWVTDTGHPRGRTGLRVLSVPWGCEDVGGGLTHPAVPAFNTDNAEDREKQ